MESRPQQGIGSNAEGAAAESNAAPVRLGLIGIGTRGTALLRSLLELPGTQLAPGRNSR